MEFNLNTSDVSLLASIAEHGVLTVKQLSSLSQRSCQVIRRRLRVLERAGVVATRERGFGRNRGRRESVIFLTDRGVRLLQDKQILSNKSTRTTDETADSICVDHELLVNWFRIHLIQTEKAIPQVSVSFFAPRSQPFPSPSSDQPFLLERVRTDNSPRKFVGFIPDGVFSIKNEKIETTLLFFLEVDMGTESLASIDRETKDVRQKILNYQTLFSTNSYKRYESLFASKLTGFRLLILANTAVRFTALCQLVKEMPPSDFIWVTDQDRMFTSGVSAEIWARGGRYENPPQSILGPRLACKAPVLALIR